MRPERPGRSRNVGVLKTHAMRRPKSSPNRAAERGSPAGTKTSFLRHRGGRGLATGVVADAVEATAGGSRASGRSRGTSVKFKPPEPFLQNLIRHELHGAELGPRGPHDGVVGNVWPSGRTGTRACWSRWPRRNAWALTVSAPNRFRFMLTESPETAVGAADALVEHKPADCARDWIAASIGRTWWPERANPIY